MRTSRTPASARARRLALALAASLAAASAASAQEAGVPAPRVVIYPGQVIREDMLVDVAGRDIGDAEEPVARLRSQLVGKMSTLTLLPGRAVPLSALANRRLVLNGGEVKLLYVDGELMIVTFGMAMQDGAAGDVIRVRNSDSGVAISGAVQPDGSVLVSGR